MLHIAMSTSRYLGEEMDKAIAAAPEHFTEEGKIAFVRNRMELAYERARELEAETTNLSAN